MCGITGAVWSHPGMSLDETVLQRMTDVLRHRGPDDEGMYRSEFRLRPPYEAMPGVALGFRRLAIIDLTTGAQPMANEDQSVWVVFNGEIYNYAALRRRLEGSGHTFRSNSDTETIVHLYEDVGLDCFAHFNGMFATAIWDARHGRLVLARDRLGKKPLVYRHEPGRLLFASELKSLLEVPGVPRDIDATALDQYLTYQYVPHPRTIFRGICKLPPGHFAVFEGGKLSVCAYWQPNLQDERPVVMPAAIEQLRELLDSAVALRMRSDVPLGAFLSGGVDSSIIVALMQRRAGTPVKTFSIGFPVPEYDETRFARRVADHLGTEHHEFQVTPNGVEVLPKLIWHYDEPFADSSAIPTWYVSRMTREHVTVALSGDGGDELFAGYPRYQAVWWGAQLDRSGPVRRVLAAPFWQRLSGARQKSIVRRFKRFSECLALSPPLRYLEWIAIFNEWRRAAIYTEDFLGALPQADPASFLLAHWQRVGSRDPLSVASLADLTTYLPCDILHKVDVASMAHSLECRQPFLDYRLVEWAAALPIQYKFRWLRGKFLLRRTYGHLLPPEIWRRPKMGFGVPLDHWFRDELRDLTHDVLLDSTARMRGYFRSEFVARLVAEHEQRTADHAYRLWALLVFELWMRQWCGPPSPSTCT